MRYFRNFSIAYLTGILLVLGCHAAAGDSLFFVSDPVSLAIYTGVSSFFFALVLFAASIPVRLLPDRIAHRLHVAAIGALVAGLVLIFLAFTGTSIMQRVHLGVMLTPYFGLDSLEQIKSVLTRFGPWVAILALAALFFSFRRRYLSYCWEIRPRLEQLSIFVLLIAIVFIPGLYGVQFLTASSANANSGAKRHLVLLVLDAMPATFIHLYNDAAEATALDDVLREGRVFTRVRTIAPYTHAYFGTLYSGRLDAKTKRGNLISRLQEGGVEARWMSFHRNGFPEGSKALTSGYRGLRSHLLTPQTAWIPEMLGLSYHVTLTGRYLTNPWARWLHGVVARDNPIDYRMPFRSALLPQIRAIQEENNRSFLIFHLSHYNFQIDAPSAPASEPSDSTQEGLANFGEEHYRYSPDEEPHAARLRDAEREYADTIGRDLASFLQELRASGLGDTVVMLTADHGVMFTKGRLWYGYHPNEEVLRVPFAVFNAGPAGIDERLFDTRDISATILDFFGLPADLADTRTFSLLRENTGREWVGSLTLRSDRYKEWYLVLSHKGVTNYWINLHPEASDRVVRFQGNGYDQSPIYGRIPEDDVVPAVAQKTLRLFGFDESAIPTITIPH